MQIRFPVVAAACAALPAVASAQCEWEALPGSPEPERVVNTVAQFQGDLYIGGEFRGVGDTPETWAIARWNGTAWESVGGGVTPPPFGGGHPVQALAVIDGELWVGGGFREMGGIPGTWGIAKWDGASWSSVDGGFESGSVLSFVEFEGDLYASGNFNQREAEPRFVARWDGASWSQVGDTGAVFGDQVKDLIVFDDGSGPAIFAALDFPMGDDAYVAKWDGEAWSPVGQGMAVTAGFNDPDVFDLEVFDGELYAAGRFQVVDGQAGTFGIVRWDGGSWVSVGGGVDPATDNDAVYTLDVYDDGSGPALFIGGQVASIGGVAVSNFAKWDGQEWSAPAAGGMDANVLELTTIDGDLYAGGNFLLAGGAPAQRVARLACDGSACYADLDGDGELTLFDFLAFQNAFDAGDTVADCDGDGDLTLFDFLCFQNAFDAGC